MAGASVLALMFGLLFAFGGLGGASENWCGVGAIASGNGEISVDGRAFTRFDSVIVDCGTEVELVAKADYGHCVNQWRFVQQVAGCERTHTYRYTTVTEKAGQGWVPVVDFKVDPDPPPPTCEDGAVSDDGSAPSLVEECELQLELLDTLDETKQLNWSPTKDISEWEGVTVAGEGEDQHIGKLTLSNKGLTGELPERLVDLE